MKMKMMFCIVMIITIWTINGHSNNEVYCVVNDDYVNVRTEPDVNSKVVETVWKKINGQVEVKKVQLRISEVVQIIKKDEKEVQIGKNKGRWVYVVLCNRSDPQTREQIKGWVFDHYLSCVDDFSELKSLKYNMNIEWAEGDAGFNYEFYTNGKCKIIFSSHMDGSFTHTGRLFIDKTKRIIVVCDDKDKKKDVRKTLLFSIKGGNVFYLNPEGKVCLPFGEPPTYTTCAKIIQKK